MWLVQRDLLAVAQHRVSRWRTGEGGAFPLWEAKQRGHDEELDSSYSCSWWLSVITSQTGH